MTKVKLILKRFWVDLLLFVLAGVFFCAFALGTVWYERIAGIGPIATFVEGSALRKANGSSRFIPVKPGSELFNLDVLWVGKGKSAVVQFADLSSLDLPEKSLVVIKKPFKPYEEQEMKDKVTMLKGTESLKTRLLYEDPPLQLPKVGKKEKKEQPAPEKEVLYYPKDKAVILTGRTREIPINFSWGKKLSGTLILKNLKAAQEVKFALRDAEYKKLKMNDVGAAYQWQIVTDDGRTIVGPFEFQIKALSEEGLNKALENVGEEGNINIDLN